MANQNLMVHGERFGRTSVYTISCALCGWGNDGFPTEANALRIGAEHIDQSHSGDALLLDAAFGPDSRCESGWTGDRCQLPLFHDGDHDHRPYCCRTYATGRCSTCNEEASMDEAWEDVKAAEPVRSDLPVVLLDNLAGRQWHLRNDSDTYLPDRKRFAFVACDDAEASVHGVEAVATESTIPATDANDLCWACWPNYWDSPRAELDATVLDLQLAALLERREQLRAGFRKTIAAPEWLLEPAGVL